ncbi:MAG: HAMP domain-containing sensor histidine kinase [Blastocatellia bacterium]
MFGRRFKLDFMTLSFGGLLLLLLGAALFVHRAINRASAGEWREKQEQLTTALRRSSQDFAAALRDLPDFSGEAKTPAQLEGWISEQDQHWRSKTAQPALLRSVSLSRLATDKHPQFARLTQTAFTKTEWPESLAALRDDLLARAQNKTLQPMTPGARAQFQTNEQFFVAVPLTVSLKPPALPPFLPPRKFAFPSFPPPALPGGRSPGGRPGGPPPFVRQYWEEREKQMQTEMQKERVAAERRAQALRKERPVIEQLGGYGVLELNTDYLRNQLLPQLIAQHFSGTELANYHVAAVSLPSQTTFFASNAQASFATFDAEEILFQGEAKAWRGAAPASPNTLVLRAQHKAGSLQAVLEHTRRRNLIAGYGVLLLLFVSASALLIATKRTRLLAQRQMEFVAGVTHELRTPLTAIQAAGFNLSSGRVNDAERVKQYGTMIHTEGRRLAELIDQVLSYARIETDKKSGEHAYNFQSVQVNEVIAQAFREYEAAFADWHIERHIPADLPTLQADANVLASALKNLLQNALKYAAEGKWLRIEAAQVKDEVQITVADQGPGIARRDLPHIFAPFYRAQDMVASAVPGTGLGLSLVSEYMKAHHGRVTVASTIDKGTAFTLHLPRYTLNGKPV